MIGEKHELEQVSVGGFACVPMDIRSVRTALTLRIQDAEGLNCIPSGFVVRRFIFSDILNSIKVLLT